MSNKEIDEFVQNENASNQVVIWSKSYCGYCRATKQAFQSLGDKVEVLKIHELDQEPNGSKIQQALSQLTGQRTVPNVFVNNQHVGGNDKVQAALQNGSLEQMLAATTPASPL